MALFTQVLNRHRALQNAIPTAPRLTVSADHTDSSRVHRERLCALAPRDQLCRKRSVNSPSEIKASKRKSNQNSPHGNWNDAEEQTKWGRYEMKGERLERDEELRSKSSTADLPRDRPSSMKPADRRGSVKRAPMPFLPAALTGLVQQHAFSIAWSQNDDQTLLAARQSGLNWAEIRTSYLPGKTPNACRKRHERLTQRRRLKVRPSQGDAVLVSLLDGGRSPALARAVGLEVLPDASDESDTSNEPDTSSMESHPARPGRDDVLGRNSRLHLGVTRTDKVNRPLSSSLSRDIELALHESRFTPAQNIGAMLSWR